MLQWISSACKVSAQWQDGRQVTIWLLLHDLKAVLAYTVNKLKRLAVMNLNANEKLCVNVCQRGKYRNVAT